jgi:hypothetical protein
MIGKSTKSLVGLASDFQRANASGLNYLKRTAIRTTSVKGCAVSENQKVRG